MCATIRCIACCSLNKFFFHMWLKMDLSIFSSRTYSLLYASYMCNNFGCSLFTLSGYSWTCSRSIETESNELLSFFKLSVLLSTYLLSNVVPLTSFVLLIVVLIRHKYVCILNKTSMQIKAVNAHWVNYPSLPNWFIQMTNQLSIFKSGICLVDLISFCLN